MLNIARFYYIACSIFFTSLPLLSLEVSIDYYEKQKFTPGSDILIDVTLYNDENSTSSFYLSDDKVFSFGFRVENEFSLPLEPSEYYLSIFAKTNTNYYREITLYPSERYSFQVNLNDYVHIPEAGLYTIKASFFPRLIAKSNLVDLSYDTERVSSQNQLLLTVFPHATDNSRNDILQLEEERIEVMKDFNLAPDAVVRYTLEAKQKRNWEKYFLYQDLESLMLEDNTVQRQYKNSSLNNQNRMREEYRNSIEKEVSSDGREYIPIQFKILKTTYTLNEATVIVSADFKIENYEEKRRYTYHLNKDMGYWNISNIDVAIEGARSVSSGIYRAP